MNLKTKKTIARELIIILCCIAIWLTTFLSMYIFGYFNSYKIGNLKRQIAIETKAVDSLNAIYSIAFDEFGIPIKRRSDDIFAESGGHQIIDKNHRKEDLLPLPPPKKISSVTTDIHDFLISNKLTSKSKLDFYHEYIDTTKQKVLYKFLLENQLTKDNFEQFSKINFPKTTTKENDFNKIEAKKIVIKKLRVDILNLSDKQTSLSRKVEISIITFLACILFTCGFRYIYYSLIWSLRVLKEK